MKKWTFPAGERGVVIDTNLYGVKEHFVVCNFKGSDSIIDMLLETDAIRRQYPDSEVSLKIPYLPYARQDRKVNLGESHSLKVMTQIINSQNYKKVYTVDTHSDVAEALIDRIEITEQWEAAVKTIDNFDYDFIIAPDTGALKKIYKLAKYIKTDVFCAEKQRNIETGDVVKTSMSDDSLKKLKNKKVLIVDDICDGGRTFLELKKILPKSTTVDLYVTHGIFSKGKSLLIENFNTVFCYNDMSV